nr:hypothetical protein B0A51_03051 [Rachicladosporium sp. CCFEE 5018]
MTVDAFAKSYYSLLLSEFGVRDATNALTTVSGIVYLQSRQDTDLAAASSQYNYKIAGKMVASGIVPNVLEPGASPTLFNSTDPTTVYTQYLCSVPKRKSGMSLVLPILIADIVSLQACWKIVTIITTWWLGRPDKEMNYCAGCVATSEGNDPGADDFNTRVVKT